ncbi:hypothetical protein [Taibaiella koreensis]|uniref:hypothetical protein n=1 Tax=Taibaiella koreensis TaxID=1268548 RepID=UPI0013C2D7FE|nr:hypothetical protein [Taibaiella koreensis]
MNSALFTKTKVGDEVLSMIRGGSSRTSSDIADGKVVTDTYTYSCTGEGRFDCTTTWPGSNMTIRRESLKMFDNTSAGDYQ